MPVRTLSSSPSGKSVNARRCVLALAWVAAAGSAAAATSGPDALLESLSLSEKIAQLQDAAPAVPRLGLPAYAWWNEGLHGLARTGQATVFPQAIGLAASWDAPTTGAPPPRRTGCR